MPQTTLTRRRGKLYVFSFTTGYVPAKCPEKRTDDSVQAHLLWLVKQGRPEEA